MSDGEQQGEGLDGSYAGLILINPEDLGAPRGYSHGALTPMGARILFVELAIDDPIEGHRAGAGADHRRQEKQEYAEARPAVIVLRGNQHRRQGKGQRKDRVGELYELQPFFDFAYHRLCYERRKSLIRPTK